MTYKIPKRKKGKKEKLSEMENDVWGKIEKSQKQKYVLVKSAQNIYIILFFASNFYHIMYVTIETGKDWTWQK